mmetsp:Transcript_3634/g.6436  ORF Transcript_3634/g.6436 Transcript_3634/m.6436 type:complete len:82 (+) Transcript_3634:359-604(+)
MTFEVSILPFLSVIVADGVSKPSITPFRLVLFADGVFKPSTKSLRPKDLRALVDFDSFVVLAASFEVKFVEGDLKSLTKDP